MMKRSCAINGPLIPPPAAQVDIHPVPAADGGHLLGLGSQEKYLHSEKHLYIEMLVISAQTYMTS
jgi:hypothetical protein